VGIRRGLSSTSSAPINLGVARHRPLPRLEAGPQQRRAATRADECDYRLALDIRRPEATFSLRCDSNEREETMNLVNWQGSAIFGPGSEWFWSMAQFVVVVITLGGIYRQLRAQGSANALHRIESLQGQFASERMDHIKLVLALDLKYQATSTRTFANARPILNFFGNLADLHDDGFISMKEIVDNWGRPLQVWSALLSPVVERQRVIENNPQIYDDREFVAKVREAEAQRGLPPLDLDQAELAEWLDFIIDQHTANLRLHQEFKSGVIPAPPIVSTQDQALAAAGRDELSAAT
jgi:hypothetical protein